MGVGIRQWNMDTGELMLDTQVDTVNRLFGTVSVDSNAGSLTDDRFAAGAPFAVKSPDGAFSQETPKTISFSGNTMSWTAGPASTLIYGVGAGSTSYNPPAGSRVGFQCRTADGSAVTLDESMFALQLIAKGSVAANSANANAFVDINCPDGKVPAIAVRNDGNGYVFVLSASFPNSTTYRVTFGNSGPTTISYWAFGQVQASQSRGIGARWYNPANSVLMGDTSVGLMRVIRANIGYSLYPGNVSQYSEAAGKKVAILLNEGGFYLYKPAASGSGSNGGSTSVSLYRAGIRTTSATDFYLSTYQFYTSSAGGSNEIRTAVNAKVTTIDVTGL